MIARGFQFSFWQYILCSSYFQYLWSKKAIFCKVVKNSYPKNRFLVNLRSFFSTYNFFPGRGWYFPVSTFKGKYFNEKLSSLAGLKKKLFNFP